MLVEGWIFFMDFGNVLLLFIICIISVVILVLSPNAGKRSSQTSPLGPAETTNQTAVHGNGNVTVSTGSGSTVTITMVTYPQDTQAPREDHDSTETKPTSEHEGQGTALVPSKALVPLVPKPVDRPQRWYSKTFFKLIDDLAKLSTEGKILECYSIVMKLMKTKTDPDSQVTLRHAATFNAINEGDIKKANRLLREVTTFLPETIHETEHRLWWSRLKSLAKMREGKCEVGIIFAKETLPLLDRMTPGSVTGWVLHNHARLIREIATSQDDDDDRRLLMKMAEKHFHHAIEHTENEHPKHMIHSQSRVPQFAKISLAFLYLGCMVTGDTFRLGSSDIFLDDIRKAKNVIASLDKEGMASNSFKFWLMMAKTCLHCRLGSYQQAYDLAQNAKVFAAKHSFGSFVKLADNTVQYLQDYV
ncbi:PREDICTED: uncharacterized protein LOC109477254 [Branchiostoma belcheri]|uniref:Uncharacterized protein LOC109477254 n=1 Tax=Branchiostoma belcheri TaxID=7741 RepID=A0A6P4ZW90_BRABE|nr:PREDICTED: uncharacterized protein LOC109477254 [Branchiostoma belcheri]